MTQNFSATIGGVVLLAAIGGAIVYHANLRRGFVPGED